MKKEEIIFISNTPGTTSSTQYSVTALNNNSYMGTSSVGADTTNPVEITYAETSIQFKVGLETKNILGYYVPVGVKAEGEYKKKTQYSRK